MPEGDAALIAAGHQILAVRTENGAEHGDLSSLDLLANLLCVGGDVQRKPSSSSLGGGRGRLRAVHLFAQLFFSF